MSRFLIALVCFFLISSSLSFSQIRLDDWKAHTSLVYTQDIDSDDEGKIWVATSGGIYSVMPDGTGLRIYRNIGEMLDLDITAIKYNKVTGELFTGSKNGYIDILDKNGNWIHITDIFNQKFSNPRINDIVFYGDKAFIAGGFGLAVFDVKKRVFDETVRRFAGFNSNLPANKIFIDNNEIWVATTSGIAKANISSILANPASWTGYPANPGLFEQSINDVVIHRGVVYAMSDKFITRLENETLVEHLRTQDIFTSILSTPETGFVFTTIFGVLDSLGNPINIPHPDLVYSVSTVRHNNGVGLVIRYQSNGIGLFINGEFINFIPNSPLSNISLDMGVDSKGNLWTATDVDPNGRGISVFDGINWRNINLKNYPEIKTNNYHKITIADDDRVAAGSYGNGLLLIKMEDEKFEFKSFNRENSKLVGLSNALDYIVCGKPRFDRDNNVWVPVLGNESSGASLVAIDKNDVSYGFNNSRNPNQRYFNSLAIDLNGTKWIGGSVVSGLGVLYVNERGNLGATSNIASGFLTQNEFSNMPDNTHPFIEVDKNGFVWIGTPRGLAVIANPSTVLQSNPNITVRNLNRIIGEQNINYILVDAQNNKWLATNNGVWVVNSDGSDTVGIINTSNSMLPTNEVLSLAYNKSTGQIYFGTKLGVYEAKSLSVEPAKSYDLKCYPQPFKPNKDYEMVIEGLEEYSDIRIVTMAGALVKQMFINSNKALWDGKDSNGNVVVPGVYLVLATSNTNKNSAVQKIAVTE